MNIKELKITNAYGESIEFGREFFLKEDFQISGLPAVVNTSQTTADGSYYQNTKLNNRDLDIQFYIKRDRREQWWIEEKREEAYRVLNPLANPMRVDFVTKADREYYMFANASAAPTFITKFADDNPKFLNGFVQMIGTDPFIYDKNEQFTEIALWTAEFVFEAYFPPPDGEIFGNREQSLIVNVENKGNVVSGMEIVFKCTSQVVRPRLLNVNTYESLILNTTMEPNDEIIVSTYRGKRSIKLIRNNVTTDIFSVLDLESTFLQLLPGDNLFRYDADSGLDFLGVYMKFTNKRIGV